MKVGAAGGAVFGMNLPNVCWTVRLPILKTALLYDRFEAAFRMTGSLARQRENDAALVFRRIAVISTAGKKAIRPRALKSTYALDRPDHRVRLAATLANSHKANRP